MSEFGKVNAQSGLNLRATPAGKKIALLDSGEAVRILEKVSFYKVQASTVDGPGYVAAEYITLTPDEEVNTQPHIIGPTFSLVLFEHEAFTGEQCHVDLDFVPALNSIGAAAVEAGLRIWVTSSIRRLDNKIEGAIVPPATFSCHHIGHAIDMNIMYGNHFYNSKMLAVSAHPRLPSVVVEFLNLFRNPNAFNLRWGGDFSLQDPVHLDDNLYNVSRELYRAKLAHRLEQAEAEA